MLKWFRNLFKKKNDCCSVEIKENTCSSCVWWKAEEENSKALKKNKNFRYCDAYKAYTHTNHSCALYKEEKFEPHEGSVKSEELNLDLNSVIEKKLGNEGSSGDIRKEY